MPQGFEDQGNTIQLFAENSFESDGQIAGAQQRDGQWIMIPDETGPVAQHQVIDPYRALEMNIVG